MFPHNLGLRRRGMGGPIVKHRRERDDNEPAVPRCYYPPRVLLPCATPVKPTWTCEEHERERVGEDEREYHHANAPGAERQPCKCKLN